MPRRAVPLTVLQVRNAKPGRYGDGNGLYLLVRPGDPPGRYWVLRYSAEGRVREMGLGRAGATPGAVPLAEARQTAGEIHRKVRAGIDPLAERKAARATAAAAKVRTFREVAGLYITAHAPTWRNPVHRRQWATTLQTYAYPAIGDRPVAAIEVGDVTGILQPIWGDKPETASRVRGRIETVLDFASANGWRTGENPARWRGHLSNILPARAKVRRVVHHAALPWRDMPAFMAALAGQAGTGAVALRFAILTAARTGEVIGAQWREVDMDAAVWTVPAARMKASREHRVPLTAAALAVLRTMRLLGDGFVFPGAAAERGLSNAAMAAVLDRMGRDDLTVHGFRSTFRDWAAETTDYPREVAEAALAHTLRDKVEAAYRRGDLFDKRRALMEAWAAFTVS